MSFSTPQLMERQRASVGMSLVIQVSRLFQQARCTFWPPLPRRFADRG